jgi:hypothetical protein
VTLSLKFMRNLIKKIKLKDKNLKDKNLEDKNLLNIKFTILAAFKFGFNGVT